MMIDDVKSLNQVIICFIYLYFFSLAPQAQSHCAFLLSLFPRKICLDWRKSVYHWALQSPHEVIRAACVKGFSLLLHPPSVQSSNMIPRSLLYVLMLLFCLHARRKTHK